MNLNPVLSEIQGLSPAAQAALGMAGHTLPQAPVITPQMKAGIAPDAGPAPAMSALHMDSPMPVLNAPQPNVSGPILGTTQGDTLNRQKIMGDGPGVEGIAKNIEGTGFGQRHPLLGKILGGVTEGAGMLGDTLLRAASPGLESHTPGTEGNYTRNLGRANAALTQDTTDEQKQAQAASENATAGKTAAETPTIAPLAQSRENMEGAQTNEANARAATVPEEEADKHSEVQPTIQHLNAESASLASPKKTPVEQTYDDLLKQGMTPIQAYEKVRENPAGTTINQGTWSLDEDPTTGKPVLFNSKTGETKDAPAGVAKAGTFAKGQAATAPAKQAIEYADSYKQGIHTGPGDEALMEKFFELAKPSTGFRMSQPQIDMLKNAQSWTEGLEAHLRHATTGTWFSDEQRDQIVGTMHDLAKAKGLEGAQGGTIRALDPQGVLHEAPAGTALPAGWKAQ